MSPDHGFDGSGVSPGRVTIQEEEYQRLVQAAAFLQGAGVSWGTPPIQPTPTAQPQGSGSSETIPGGSSDAPLVLHANACPRRGLSVPLSSKS